MLLLLPIISAFIGWFTNWIAVKMLFHPRLEKKFLGIRIQGIFPKRQAQFAEKLGQLVSKELISIDQISQKINSPQTLEKLVPQIEQHVSHFIDNKLKEEIPLLSMFISGNTLDNIKKGIVQEFENLFPSLVGSMTKGLQQDINIEKIVFEKVNGFSSDKLESILMDIMKREFKFVEIIGGVLGFIIGLLQVLITMIGQ